jgi:hypothetical protein
MRFRSQMIDGMFQMLNKTGWLALSQASLTADAHSQVETDGDRYKVVLYAGVLSNERSARPTGKC